MDTPSAAALGLVTAAVSASGPVPSDPVERAAWLAEVADLALCLYRPAQEVEAEMTVFAQCRPVRGIILEAKEQMGHNGPTGRGLVVIKPTMGKHADDPDATEPMRTPWLNEPRGAALFAQAQALAGTGIECRLGKWNETIDAGPDKGNKRGMVAWIEPIGRPAPAPVPRQAPPVPPPRGSARPQQAPQQAQQAPQQAQQAPQQAQQAPAAAAAPARHTVDVETLRKLRIGNHKALLAASRDYLGLTPEQVGEAEMRCCGPTGANSSAQLAEIWNELLNRSLQPA